MRRNHTDHTFIYIISHCNPSVRIIVLVSHTNYVVYVLILYISGETYSLKSTPNDRFFEKHFLQILLEIYWGEVAEEILFVFYFEYWRGAWILALRLINQHTTH